MTTTIEEVMRQASSAASQSQWETAASLFISAIRMAPAHRPAWNRQLSLMPGIVDLWQKCGGDRFTILNEIFTVLLSYRLHDTVLELAALYPASETEEVLCLYAAACVHILRDDEDTAFGLLNRFKALVERNIDQLPVGAEDPFNIAYRQGMLVEDLPYVEALMSGEAPSDIPRIELYQPLRLNPAEHVIVASCNGLYFDIFAEAYCHAIDRMMDGALLHLHVMEPEPRTAERVERLMNGGLQRTVLNVSWEVQSRHRSRSYFASNRFMLVPQLLDLYGRDLLVSDIDIEFTADTAPLHPRLAGQDFACYAYSGFGPASRYIAYLTYFSKLRGREVVEVVNRFVCSKLHIPSPHNWMLDQAALISGLRWLRKEQPELVIGRMDELLGRPAESLFRMQDRDEDKDAAIVTVNER